MALCHQDDPRWNGSEMSKHNCYSYSVDKAWHGNWLKNQPGTHSNRAEYQTIGPKDYNCPDLTDRVLADFPHFQVINCKQSTPKGKRKILLAVQEGVDYHFYREENDGTWSSKPGIGPVSCLPRGQNPVSARVRRNNGSNYKYDTLCTCFLV